MDMEKCFFTMIRENENSIDVTMKGEGGGVFSLEKWKVSLHISQNKTKKYVRGLVSDVCHYECLSQK